MPFIDAIDRGEENYDWCHLCEKRERYLIQFESRLCDYTRLCENCINLMALKIRNKKEQKNKI